MELDRRDARSLDLKRSHTVVEALDLRPEDDPNAARLHRCLQLLAVVLENASEFGSSIRQCDLVLLGQRKGRLHRRVASYHHQDVLAAIVLGAVQAMKDRVAFLAGDVQLAGIATHSGRKHHPRGVIGCLVS